MEILSRYWKRVLVSIVVILVIISCVHSGGFFKGEEASSYRYLERGRVEYETERYPVYVDVIFSGEERVEIRRAIGRWNEVLNGYRELYIVSEEFVGDLEISRRAIDGGAYLILRIPWDSPLLANRGSEVTLGFTNAIGGAIIYLVPDNIDRLSGYGARIYNVLLHEIGHLFGARHVESGLMRGKYDIISYICIDSGTARQVGEYYGYNWERMNYCVKD